MLSHGITDVSLCNFRDTLNRSHIRRPNSYVANTEFYNVHFIIHFFLKKNENFYVGTFVEYKCEINKTLKLTSSLFSFSPLQLCYYWYLVFCAES